MNIKKIGLTALAASLVSVSAQAGELSVAGGASIGLKTLLRLQQVSLGQWETV